MSSYSVANEPNHNLDYTVSTVYVLPERYRSEKYITPKDVIRHSMDSNLFCSSRALVSGKPRVRNLDSSVPFQNLDYTLVVVFEHVEHSDTLAFSSNSELMNVNGRLVSFDSSEYISAVHSAPLKAVRSLLSKEQFKKMFPNQGKFNPKYEKCE